MGEVWVRCSSSSSDGEGRALQFDLHDNKFLMLKSIAAHWSFDPCKILVGTLVLTPDADGNSIRHVDAIRAYSSPKGLGDGLTEQTAFILTGKPVQPPAAAKGPPLSEAAKLRIAAMEAAIAAANKAMYVPKRPLAENVAIASSISEEDCMRLPPLEKDVLLPYRRLLVQEQWEGSQEELFEQEGAPHHYSTLIKSTERGLQPEILRKEVATMVGTLHIIPQSKSLDFTKQQHAASAGMVTLVRPDGLCLTASDCLLKYTRSPSKYRIFVCFPRLTGTTSYECRIARTHDLVVHLEMVVKQSFQRCMAPSGGRAGVFIFDAPSSMNLVRCMEVEARSDPFEMVVLPTKVLHAKAALGGPVFGFLGDLKGVVVDANSHLGSESDKPRKRCVTRSGRELVTQSVKMLEPLRSKALMYKEIHERLGNTNAIEAGKEYNLWTSALTLRRLVQVGPAKFRTVTMDWFDQNPFTKFVDKVISFASQPPKRLRLEPVVYKPLSEADLKRFEAEQKIMREYTPRLDSLDNMTLLR